MNDADRIRLQVTQRCPKFDGGAIR